MRNRLFRMQLAAWLLAGAAATAAVADEPSLMRRATQAVWPIRWYIPPTKGPVVGNQNGWFVTPHDILPGDFTFSGEVKNATAESFEMTPNSVWGDYRFKITRTGAADEPTPDLKLRRVVPVRTIHFADLTELTGENTLLFRGSLKEISPDRKTLVAEMDFRDGPVACRFELIESAEKTIPPDIRSMHYGPHWQHTMDVYYPDSPDPIARESTRVTCAFPVQAQTSLDPQQMRAWIPQITYGAHAFFTGDELPKKGKGRFEYFLSRREEILPWIEEFSAYGWVSADDPPFLHNYGGQKDVIPAEDGGNATHHPKFGEHLHKRLKELGVESCYWADNVKCDNPRYHGWAGLRLSHHLDSQPSTPKVFRNNFWQPKTGERQ